MLPFEGVRVVELGSGTALAFCGKLFSDFGAEVFKVEAPGGDRGRHTPPLVQIGDGHLESAYLQSAADPRRSWLDYRRGLSHRAYVPRPDARVYTIPEGSTQILKLIIDRQLLGIQAFS